MIASLFKTLSRGFDTLKTDRRLLLVAVLVFVFPLLFLYVSQSFFDAAYTNLQTAEKRRVGILHDSVSALLKVNEPEIVQSVIEKIASENPEIQEIRILKRNNDALLIENSLDSALRGTPEVDSDLFSSPVQTSGTSLIYELIVDQSRTWRAVRVVSINPSTQYYIFSEHSFSQLDEIMAQRRQESYLALTVIFVFLISLAWWVSRQRDWEKRYLETQQQLADRDLFTTMIAHEFRSPLTVISGYASFLAESTKLSSEESRYVSNIQVSVARLLALVNDFLEVARIQSKKLSVSKDRFDITETLAACVQSLKLSAQEKNLVLTFDSEPSPIYVSSDSKRLSQIIHNLLTNAIKYTNSGSVTLSLINTPRQYTITIKDTGTGISAADQPKLFAPFSRVGGVDDSTITGSGLGMWITKQLVELLSGTISVESIKNVGTHVVIVFPH